MSLRQPQSAAQLCLAVLCLWGAALVSGSDFNWDASSTLSDDLLNEPLSAVVDLKECRTPNREVMGDVIGAQKEAMGCTDEFTIHGLTGGEISYLEDGGSVEVSCRHDMQSLVFEMRDHASVVEDPLSAIVGAFKTFMGVKSHYMAIERLPLQCECAWDDKSFQAYALDYDSEGRVQKVHVTSTVRALHDVKFQDTTCAMPRLDVMDPHHLLQQATNRFRRVRKCLWKLDLIGKGTPFVRATRRAIIVRYVKENGGRTKGTKDPWNADPFDGSDYTLTLELPRECIMSRIYEEILVWSQPYRVFKRTKEEQTREEELAEFTRLYINIEPEHPKVNIQEYHKYESASRFLSHFKPRARKQL